MNSSTIFCFNFKHHNTKIIENLFLGQQREEKKYNFNHKFRTPTTNIFFCCFVYTTSHITAKINIIFTFLFFFLFKPRAKLRNYILRNSKQISKKPNRSTQPPTTDWVLKFLLYRNILYSLLESFNSMCKSYSPLHKVYKILDCLHKYISPIILVELIVYFLYSLSNTTWSLKINKNENPLNFSV